jgi:hypothetical protein
MRFSSTELENIAKGDYSFDFINITLTQMTEESPLVYSGSGSVFFDEDGVLQLKMYHVFENKEQAHSALKEIFKNPILGEIIPKEDYFSMKAYDLEGNEWNALRLWLSRHSSQSGQVITAKIWEISNSEAIEKTEKLELRFIAKGKLDFPWNSFAESNGFESLSLCEIESNYFSWTAQKLNNDITDIRACFEQNDVNKLYSKLFLESLSIALGKYIHPVIWIEAVNGKKLTTINSRSQHFESKSTLPPIPKTSRESEHIAMFIENYLNVIDKPNSPMFGYWWRILDSDKSNVENKALILTTAIEGFLEQYFNEFGKPDAEFAEQAKQAKEIVEQLTIGDRAKNRLLSSLNNANDFTVKNALHKLQEKNIVTADMIKIWGKLRNKYAHPKQLKYDNKKFRVTVDRTHVCIGIFYILLLSKLNYTGMFINYSKTGWPEELFTAGTVLQPAPQH